MGLFQSLVATRAVKFYSLMLVFTFKYQVLLLRST